MAIEGDLRYLEFDFSLQPIEPWRDVMIAMLGEIEFESFAETDTGFVAYIQEVNFNQERFDALEFWGNELVEVAFAKANVEPTNWNSEWEKNFTPIVVENRCEIRAPFHESQGLEYEIVIEPKMSFGTGHHQTTHMMIQFLLQEDLTDKFVLDMGSGTGVLAILAAMRGAAHVDAIDIDQWCFENAAENVERNNIENLEVFVGDVFLIKDKVYDFIIANINRNILLADIPHYANSLHGGGSIIFSGFYEADLPLIIEACNNSGIYYDSHITRDNWVGLKCTKA